MSLLNILNIAGSAINAQAQNMNIISNNLANIDTVSYRDGKYTPYCAKKAIFKLHNLNESNIDNEVQGVQISHVVNDSTPMKVIYDPSNPMSDDKGYVLKSNVNPISEIINNISAARSYQANIEVLKSAKNMILKTLTLSE